MVTARPATATDALEFAGGRSLLRKALLWQVRNFPSEVIELEGEPLALVMMQHHPKARVEVSIHFRPGAQAHMRELIKLAQLTIRRLGQDGFMAMAVVRDSNAQGQRMARLAGFRPVSVRTGTLWIAERTRRHDIDIQQPDGRQQGSRETAGAGA